MLQKSILVGIFIISLAIGFIPTVWLTATGWLYPKVGATFAIAISAGIWFGLYFLLGFFKTIKRQ